MSWFSTERAGREGWRLDIVSLLAVIGEGAMESHVQPMTSSWTCILPRIIPAPRVLLKSNRPTRMPEFPAAIAGVWNGTSVGTLNFFPNIIHPIDELPAFAFRVLEIRHKDKSPQVTRRSSPEKEMIGNVVENDEMEAQHTVGMRRSESTLKHIQRVVTETLFKPRPHIPTQSLSPLNLLSVISCLLTIGLLILATIMKDGTACLALITISLSSSIVGYASWWSPILKRRPFQGYVPDGDLAIRTREGAFIIVKCNENVARELYTGTEECHYYVGPKLYRILVGFGIFLLMISVVLLGNCDFPMQAAIGGSYMVLNGALWLISLLHKDWFWDLGLYVVRDVTPSDALHADVTLTGIGGDRDREKVASFTRTLWYAIRETKEVGWVGGEDGCCAEYEGMG